jgi:hypothetical protein
MATINWYNALDASMHIFIPVYPFSEVSLMAPGQLSRMSLVSPLIPTEITREHVFKKKTKEFTV